MEELRSRIESEKKYRQDLEKELELQVFIFVSFYDDRILFVLIEFHNRHFLQQYTAL